jgi:hypothetical protein
MESWLDKPAGARGPVTERRGLELAAKRRRRAHPHGDEMPASVVRLDHRWQERAHACERAVER